MKAIYRHGSVLMVDHTAAADITAGDVVLVQNETRIAHSDIPSGELGALAAPAGTVVYEVAKTTGVGEGFSDGDAVYWNDTTKLAINADGGGTHKRLGTAVADAGDSAATVSVRHHV